MTLNQNHYTRAPFPLALWGVLLLLLGFAVFGGTALIALPSRLIFEDSSPLREIVWWAGAPVLLGSLLILADLLFLTRRRHQGHVLVNNAIKNPRVTVVLTAYNDELSIGAAVRDFAAHPLAQRVIVVDNNSTDATAQVAEAAGAIVVKEPRQGYGQCVYRALSEGAAYEDTALVALCEGDMTFRASDLGKLLAYMPHGDVVNGTRIVEQLRSPVTQLTTFMFWGNYLGAKLLEAKHLGRGTISDLGTTYKLCRSQFLRDNLGLFDPAVNLEFNAYFLDTLLGNGFKLVEAPVTFHPRVGESKGGNVSNVRAIRVGVRMLTGIVISWRMVRKGDEKWEPRTRQPTLPRV